MAETKKEWLTDTIAGLTGFIRMVSYGDIRT